MIRQYETEQRIFNACIQADDTVRLYTHTLTTRDTRNTHSFSRTHMNTYPFGSEKKYENTSAPLEWGVHPAREQLDACFRHLRGSVRVASEYCTCEEWRPYGGIIELTLQLEKGE
jgi:hypothetical protein